MASTKDELFQPGEQWGGSHDEDEIIVFRYRKGSAGERKSGCPPIWSKGRPRALATAWEIYIRSKNFLYKCGTGFQRGLCNYLFRRWLKIV